MNNEINMESGLRKTFGPDQPVSQEDLQSRPDGGLLTVVLWDLALGVAVAAVYLARRFFFGH
jgi:hypothetical protein